jgi:hypothetical protein
VILQRRFASSLYALLKSLERRKERLEEFLRAGFCGKREKPFWNWRSWRRLKILQRMKSLRRKGSGKA